MCVRLSLPSACFFPPPTEWESSWPLPVNDVSWSWVFPHCSFHGNNESNEVELQHSWIWFRHATVQLGKSKFLLVSLVSSLPGLSRSVGKNLNKLAERQSWQEVQKCVVSTAVCMLKCQQKYTHNWGSFHCGEFSRSQYRELGKRVEMIR